LEDFNRNHLSFALGELNLRLEDFYNMGWNEYLIKCYAYNRMTTNAALERWQQTRFIAFHSRMAYQYKAPLRITDILKLEGDNFSDIGVNDESMELARKERAEAKAHNEQYLKEKQ